MPSRWRTFWNVPERRSDHDYIWSALRLSCDRRGVHRDACDRRSVRRAGTEYRHWRTPRADLVENFTGPMNSTGPYFGIGPTARVQNSATKGGGRRRTPSSGVLATERYSHPENYGASQCV